ncbi:unnamed protein product [Soboliphyme baturini]|uniref:SMC_N domain-containing protein n=1 Tax=Soboliphyme baturini TaxID=241478 RepID=A0A183IUZ0_9BILA|nr:unnamed protein product [Soboliphyme baturini]
MTYNYEAGILLVLNPNLINTPNFPSDLKAKAKRWDEKAVAHLRTRRLEIIEHQKELHRIRRKESDISLMQNSIKQLETRVKYMITDKENIEQRVLANLNSELTQHRNEYDMYTPQMVDVENRMKEREKNIRDRQSRLNEVTDHVFTNFCSRIGVTNIRQYEEREVRFEQEKRKKLLEFDDHIGKLKNELDYQKSEDNRESEKKIELTKQQRVARKAELEEKENETNEVKKQLAQVQKEQTSIQKQISAMEAKIEHERSERHLLLQTCKMEDIKLPLDEQGSSSSSLHNQRRSQSSLPSGSASQDSSMPESTQEQYQRENMISVDYSLLTSELTAIDSKPEVQRVAEHLAKEISEMQEHLCQVAAPNSKADELLEGARERLAETSEEFEQAKRKAKKAKLEFEKIKKERCDRFNKCFEHVAGHIDGIYKSLSRNTSAQAYLVPENPEEPYLEGVSYNCVAPGKRFRAMDNLSGGEKALAALALLFAVHSYNAAPFFVLDEIDAALDNTNIGKVARFICEKSKENMQLIVISLKEETYNRADALVGIYPLMEEINCSQILTLDLTQYNDMVEETQATATGSESFRTTELSSIEMVR